MKIVAVSGGGNIVAATAMSDNGDMSVTMRMSPQEAEKAVLRLLFTLASLNSSRWQRVYDDVRDMMR